MRKNSLLVVAALITVLVMVSFASRFLKGSLTNDQVLALADTDHSGVLSTGEMRKVIVKMIQAMMTHNLTYDLNASGVTDGNDLTILVQSIRAYLAAVCGNGAVEAGEQCDHGSQNGVQCTTESANYACQYCSSACMLTMYSPPAVCGNGFREPGEGCDDGNKISQDDCSATCSVETHYACVDYACGVVLGFGLNTCNNTVGCLPPPNDGIQVDIVSTANPITSLQPTTVNITIHSDKIRQSVIADVTFSILDRETDDVVLDPRCTRIRPITDPAIFHLSCSLGTIVPSADVHLSIGFTSMKYYGCTGLTPYIDTKVLVQDNAFRSPDDPPLVPYKGKLPYTCITPPVNTSSSRIDAVCTSGRFGLGPNDYYTGFAHFDDPVTRTSNIFAEATSFVRYFRYNHADHTIGPQAVSFQGPGFVTDAVWDSVRNVAYLVLERHNHPADGNGTTSISAFDPVVGNISTPILGDDITPLVGQIGHYSILRKGVMKDGKAYFFFNHVLQGSNPVLYQSIISFDPATSKASVVQTGAYGESLDFSTYLAPSTERYRDSWKNCFVGSR